MARRGNLTAVYKYRGVWGHVDRLFKLKVRGAQPHVGTSKCQPSLPWKGESGTNTSRDQGRGFPKWPSPVTGSTRSVRGWGRQWLHWGLSQLLPSLGKGWAVQGQWSTSAMPGDSAHSSVSHVLGSLSPLVPAATTSPVCQALHATRVTRVQPVPAPWLPCGEWLLVQWAPAFSIHVLMNHLTKMQPDSGWICSEQCGFVEGTTALRFPRQDPAAQPSSSTPARNQGSGGSPEQTLGRGGCVRDGENPGCPRISSQMPVPPLALSPAAPAADLGKHQPGSPDTL